MSVENNQWEDAHDRQINAALTTYPVAPLPPNFTRQVMAQVQLTPQELPVTAPPAPLRHYFRLYSFEFAVATVLTLVLVLGIGWPLLTQVLLAPASATDSVTVNTYFAPLLTASLSSWYAAGLCGVILLELGIALLAWVTWMEQPRLKVR